MSRRKKADRADENAESLHEFLERKLPPSNIGQAQYLANALREAGARYDRLNAERNEWRDYSARGARLKSIKRLAGAVTSSLCKLDILSRNDLENRFDPKQIAALIGSLQFLSNETADLANRFRKVARGATSLKSDGSSSWRTSTRTPLVGVRASGGQVAAQRTKGELFTGCWNYAGRHHFLGMAS